MENSVSPQNSALVREPIGDVAAGVAGDEEHLGLAPRRSVGVAVVDLDVDAGDAGRVVAGADDGAAGRRLDLEVSADVIAVMVGVEDVGDVPAALPASASTGPATAGSTTPTEPLCGSRINQT